MSLIRKEELKENIRYNSLYAAMFGVISLITFIMNFFPTNIEILNALFIAITIVSTIMFIYILIPLINNIKSYKDTIEVQDDLENTLRISKLDKVLLDLNYQLDNESIEKNNKSISEILDL